MSRQFVTEGDANGVAGKKGVPAVESMSQSAPDIAGICTELAASLAKVDGSSVVGNRYIKDLYANNDQNTNHKMGIDSNTRIGTVHGIKISRQSAKIEDSTE